MGGMVLKKMQATGPVQANRFDWPSLNQFKKLTERGKSLRLTGVELGGDQSMYGMRLHFTDGISSPYL